MASPRSRALSAEADAPGLETRRGEGWIATVHPAWCEALKTAGLLRRAPIEDDADFFAGVASGRGGVYRVPLDVGAAMIRPVRRGGWLAPLLGPRLLGPGRALTEARVTAALRTRGAPVPEPVMALAWRSFGPFWCALVATREEAGSRDGSAFLAAEPRGAALREVVDAAGIALRKFHEAGGRHRDLNLGNLLIGESGGAGTGSARVWVIDLDGARVGRPPSPRRRMRELMRLHRSLRKSALGDLRRLSVRLFHSYCGGDRRLRSRMLRWRRIEALFVAIHALRYRAR